MELSKEQKLRYSRHTMLPEVGEEGQKKLLASKALLIGAGGLGSPLGLYLAAAGVGTIGIVDFDMVDLSNLQRQVIHSNDSIGTPKTLSAKKRIEGLNPDVRVNVHEVRLSSQNAMQIFKDYDVIIDGTDNFPTRYLTNDACFLLGKPNIYGSIFRFDGQATVFWPGRGPCYRCLYPEPPPPGMVPSCAEGGVLGILPGVVGLIQATEAVKVLLGIGRPLVGRLLIYDALKMTFRELRLREDPACPLCGENATIKKLVDYEEFCGLRGESQINEMNVVELKRRLDGGEEFLLLDVREPNEFEIARIEGSKLIPLGSLESRIAEIEEWKDKPVVVHCKMGGRSLQACRKLVGKGFRDVTNVKGGINSWAVEVDPGVKTD